MTRDTSEGEGQERGAAAELPQTGARNGWWWSAARGGRLVGVAHQAGESVLHGGCRALGRGLGRGSDLLDGLQGFRR